MKRGAAIIETAAPQFRALATGFPGDTSLTLRASMVERSLGRTENAVTFARNISQAKPRDHDALARVGDTLADRELSPAHVLIGTASRSSNRASPMAIWKPPPSSGITTNTMTPCV